MDALPPLLIDTHCHLADTGLAGRLSSVINTAKEAGVVIFIVPGTTPEDWQRLHELQAKHPEIAAAFGLHPMHAAQFSPELLERLEPFLPPAVAIGEIGLDYCLDVPRDVQRHAFRQQLRLAFDRGLPVLIHCRKAFQDMFSIINEERQGGPVKGVMHAYSGSVETAWQCIDLGLHISLAGTVTFANAVRPVAVARAVPLTHLLLETDAPDLSPEPYRGQQNEPAFLVSIAAKIATIKGVSLEDIATATTNNAVDLFNVSPTPTIQMTAR